MNPLINDFIQCRKIAVVGISGTSNKFGNMACKELKKRGFEIFPVHPSLGEVEGIGCHPDLKSVQGLVEALFVSIHPKKVIPLLEEAASLGFKNIWLQQGSNSKEVQDAIARLQLQVVVDKCILMYAPPVTSIHKFHRGIMKIFGKL